MKKKYIISIAIVLVVAVVAALFFVQPAYFRYIDGDYVSKSVSEMHGSDGIVALKENMNIPNASGEFDKYLPEEVQIVCKIVKISDLPEGEVLPNASEDEAYRFFLREKVDGQWREQELHLFNRNIFFGKDNSQLLVKITTFGTVYCKDARLIKIKVGFGNQWMYSAMLSFEE